LRTVSIIQHSIKMYALLHYFLYCYLTFSGFWANKVPVKHRGFLYTNNKRDKFFKYNRTINNIFNFQRIEYKTYFHFVCLWSKHIFQFFIWYSNFLKPFNHGLKDALYFIINLIIIKLEMVLQHIPNDQVTCIKGMYFH